MSVSVDVVVPSARPELVPRLRRRLEGLPGRVLVIDGRGRAPAAARNEGWRASSAEWVAFLDDDVVPCAGWAAALLADLESAGPRVAGSQGRITVPLPAGCRPTDWERSVRGLESARWATADMAYRRSVLEELGGFDERFRRAYREDADLALRVLRAGYELEQGSRTATHPVGEADALVSLRKQAGNADDVLMRAKHGPRWRQAAGAPAGRLRRHTLTTGALAAAGAAAFAGRRTLAGAGLAAWGAATAELAFARIAPGPRTPREVTTMALTSGALPPLAVAHALAGWIRYGPRALRRRRTRAVLLDRDGTIVEDVPYNASPSRVHLVPGARHALARVRAAGVPIAVVTNQSAVARGLARPEDVEAVNRRIDQLAGHVDAWLVCPHGPEDRCDCRKPAPGLVLDAARRLGVRPRDCVVIGDIGSDLDAARAAGARGVIVPTARTLRGEVTRSRRVARDLCEAVELALEGTA